MILKIGAKFEEKPISCFKNNKNLVNFDLSTLQNLCVMDMKNDAKFEQKLTGQFKIDMRNLMIFDSSTQNSQ